MKLRENEIRRVVSSYRNYSLAKRYTEMDVVEDMWITLDDQLNYVVKASLRVYNKIEKCEILISPEGHVLNYGCECIWCDRMSACAHIGAILFLIEQLQPESFPFRYLDEKQRIKEELDRRLELMERRRKRDTARYSTRFFMDEVMDDFTRQVDAQMNMTKYRLYAEMNIDRYRGCTLTFKVGAERLYVIKNITEFLGHISSKDRVKYGKTCEFVHSMDAFDEASREIISFFRTLKEQGGYNYYGLQREVQVTNEILDLMYETFSDMDQQHCNFQCAEHAFYPEVYCEKDENEIVVTLESENFYCGNDALYRLDASKNMLIRKEGSNPSVLLNLMRTLKKNTQVVLEQKQLIDFYRYVYEEVKDEVLWQGYRFHDLDALEDSCVLYGDVDNRGRIYFILECVYEDGSRTYAIDSKNTPHNMTTERICRALITYGDEVDTDKGIVYFDETAEKTYTFLKEVLPVIQSDCDVYVSSALNSMGSSRKYGISVGIGVEHNLLELNVYSDEIPASELMDVLKAYRRKRKFHRLKNGQLLSLESEELAELDEVMEQYNVSTSQFKNGTAHMNLYRAVALNRTADEMEHLRVRRNDKFNALIDRFKSASKEPIALNERYDAILRDYQKTGIQWMNTLSQMGFGGILADDMGLGKTLQVIALLDAQKKKPNLVVCPSSLILNWQDEIEKFAPHLNVVCIYGSAAARSYLTTQIHECDIAVTSYDYLRRDIESLEKIQFETVILDEAQYIKNQKTKNALSVKRLKSHHRFALTGTPIENSLAELWSIFDFLMPDYLYNYHYFQTHYEKGIVRENDAEKSRKLKQLIEPFVLRRTKKEVLTELPDKIEKTLTLDFNEEEMRMYIANLSQVNQKLSNLLKMEQVDKIQILAMLTRLRQICAEPRILYENVTGLSSKLEGCLELLETLRDSGKKTLLFSSFTSVLDLIEEECRRRHFSVIKLTGSTSKEDRRAYVQRFQSGDADVFLISLKAGGTGLNLTAAEAVIHYDPWWNISAENQATDRAYRIGQNNNVQVFKLIMKDSVEERMTELQQKKKELSDLFVGNNEGSLSKMTTEDLIRLFEL